MSSSIEAFVGLGVILMLISVSEGSSAPTSNSSQVSSAPTSNSSLDLDSPSMEDQIKKKLAPIELLFQYGMVRNILKEVISKVIEEDKAKGITNDTNFAERILEVVMTENTWMEGNRYTLKREIKKGFNHGKLTKEDVDKVFDKMLNIIKEKTKVEIGLALEELRYGLPEIETTTLLYTVPNDPKLNV